uniref:UDP-glucuronosyltransferase 2A3-like n=1 Tax=Phascolarctos cinereus TaxID=38626 RepID=A0A6P5JWB5_PHACI|nr:UDP-glucuronosyltransferase 2A3-like [Phascolarctos cinereus]
MTEKWVSILLLLQLCCFGCGSCGKVLMWPLEHSHWLNMMAILEELAQRGHLVTVLVSSDMFLTGSTDSSGLNYDVFPVPEIKELVDNLDIFLSVMINKNPTFSHWEKLGISRIFQHLFSCCKIKLQQTGYDMLLADAAFPCGDLIAEVLEIPFINSLRWSMGNAYEKYCGGLPSPLSYVPMPMGRLTDKMTFMDRVENIQLSLFFD